MNKRNLRTENIQKVEFSKKTFRFSLLNPGTQIILFTFCMYHKTYKIRTQGVACG